MTNAAEGCARSTCRPAVRRRRGRSALRAAFVGAGLLLSTDVVRAQQGSAVLLGRVRDVSTEMPVSNAVVTVTSSSLQGEAIAVTDETGAYRIADLPPGTYILRVQEERFKPYAREGLELHAETTVRLNAALLPETLQAAEVEVVARTPTVDVGSTITGMNITSDLTRRVPLSAPGLKGSVVRSFESVADVLPGAQFDAFGVSIAGTSSPENRYLLDGSSVNTPVYGLLATPLSIDFIQEVSVLSGGYMPEYGRATGGIVSAITKSGSNAFHGSVFMNVAPGGFTGPAKAVRRHPLNGPYSALAHQYPVSATNVLLKWSSQPTDSITLDHAVGWHRAASGRLPSDGSAVGGRSGLAGISNVWWLRNNPPHSIAEFESVPDGACDAPDGAPDAVVCPVSDYHTGGPEYLEEQSTHRLQGRSMLTYLIEGLGRHVLKTGVDVEHDWYEHTRAYSGARDFVESDDGSYFLDGRVFGYLTGPDEPVVLDSLLVGSGELHVVVAARELQRFVSPGGLATRPASELGLRPALAPREPRRLLAR